MRCLRPSVAGPGIRDGCLGYRSWRLDWPGALPPDPGVIPCAFDFAERSEPALYAMEHESAPRAG